VDVFDVVDGFFEQHGDVAVVECVDDASAGSLADDESEVAQDTELVGDGGLLHLDRLGEVGDRARAVAEVGKDADAARCGERLHRLRDLAGCFRVECSGLFVPAVDSVSHRLILHEGVFIRASIWSCLGLRFREEVSGS
jgi:hypothetical protein